MPVISAISFGAYAYAAYDRNRRHFDWRRYAAAGVLTLGIVPFTIAVMNGTNQALLQIAADGTAAAVVNDESVRALITQWAGLNFLRSLLPLAGAVLGVWQLVDEKAGSTASAEGTDVTKSHPASSTTKAGGQDVSKTHPASY